MAATAAYKAKVKVGTDVAQVRGTLTIPVGKGPIEITCLGDTSRSFLIGLENRQDITFTLLRNTSDTAYIALQTAYTNETTVVLDMLDAAAATAFKANYYVTNKNANFGLEDAELVEWTFVKTGATTTDAI